MQELPRVAPRQWRDPLPPAVRGARAICSTSNANWERHTFCVLICFDFLASLPVNGGIPFHQRRAARGARARCSTSNANFESHTFCCFVKLGSQIDYSRSPQSEPSRTAEVRGREPGRPGPAAADAPLLGRHAVHGGRRVGPRVPSRLIAVVPRRNLDSTNTAEPKNAIENMQEELAVSLFFFLSSKAAALVGKEL